MQVVSSEIVFDQVRLADSTAGDSEITLAIKTLSVAVVRTLAKFGL